ncbi:hypothetical protein [Deinococcus hohokamensis]|uniref:Uncharacterized protein n=1 Tax=Deinococcus hohokamensis TaxID=309883 RepID=A0ABV9I9B3_9DEIO
MSEPRPSLLVILPPDWDLIPNGVAELKRYLADEFRASLLIRGTDVPMRAPLTLYLGVWDRRDKQLARRDVDDLLPRAFYTLNWMDEVS